MTLAIFNPEHDLCLANGRAHYLPPQTAVDFARRGASLMRILYPDAHCISIYDTFHFSSFCRASAALTRLRCQAKETSTKLIFNSQLSVVPWGWDIVVKTGLLERGIPEHLLPSDGQLDSWRKLQHRATLLPLQPDCRAIHTLDEANAFLRQHSRVVFKAPWSGSGRGLRWVAGSLTPHDIAWVDKVIRRQQCVIGQPRYEVADDFALEYCIEGQDLHFIGYSLFQSLGGVYHGNMLLPDLAIEQRVGFSHQMRERIEAWIGTTLVGHYEGPLGIDLIHTVGGGNYVSELNLRHTMGHVAHAYLQQHPRSEGTLFSPAEYLHPNL